MRKIIFVPPGGFQGFAQQSIATRSLLQRVANPRRRKLKRAAPKKRTPSTRRRVPGGPVKRRARPAKKRTVRARMVKGSPAARRHMAKLRKMRKR